MDVLGKEPGSDGTPTQEPALTRAILEALDPVDGWWDRYRELARVDICPDSRRAEDEGRSAGLGHEVWDLATDQLSSSLDHLIAWRGLFGAGKQPAFAHLTILRGAMEATVTARWLVAGPDADERIGRAVSLMHYDYGERAKAERTLGLEASIRPPARAASLRQGDLEGQRIADHLPWFRFPGPTRLFALHGEPAGDPGEGVYRLLSAYAHSRRWRLLLGPSAPVGKATTGGQVMRISANDDMALVMTQLAMQWVQHAIEEAAAYTGVC